MKMNARKLTIALIALLLALTCVFVACKKDEPNIDVDNKQETKEPETQEPSVSKEELEQVAKDFKKDFNDNYLSLYTDAVAAELEGYRSEAILNITGAKTLDEAKAIAAAYIKKLQEAKTIVDEVKELIEKIGDVALADEEDVNLLASYNALVEQKFLTAAGPQKDVTDAYQSETWGTVKAIVARLKTLKVAKVAANSEGGLNDRIAAILAKAQAAKAYTADGEYELDTGKLTLKDYEDLVVLQAHVAAFVDMYELVENSEARAEILDEDDLNEADDLFETKTANHRQITRARNVIETAKALAVAARAAGRVNGQVAATELKIATPAELEGTTATRYFISYDKFYEGEDTVLPNEDIVNPVKVSAFWGEEGYADGKAWVARADLYASLMDAYAALNTLQVMEVVVTGDTGAHNPFMVAIPVEGAYYVLDENMQAAAQAAYEAAVKWDELLSEAGNDNLREALANTFFRDITKTILERYNASMTTALRAYNEFAARLVAKNYVDTYPVKAPTYNEYVLTTDTQTAPETANYGEDWKAALYDEILRLKQSAETNYEDGSVSILDLFATFNDYTFDAKYLDESTIRNIKVDLHKNEDGSFTPSISYKVFAYEWLVYNLARNEQVTVTAGNTGNTDVLATVINNVNKYFFEGGSEEYDEQVNFYKLSKALVDWVKKYIETIPESVFDLAPFQTVTADPAAFGDVKMTFADEKLEEKAIPQVTKLNGAAVEATPSEALDITVYADYTVALKAIEEFDRLVAELEETAAQLKADVRGLFAPGEADAIEKLDDEYNVAMAKYATCVLQDNTIDPEHNLNSLQEELKRIDELNWNRYAWIIETAKALQDRALALYPHTEWDNALDTLKAKFEAAQADVDLMTKAQAALKDALDAAEAELARLEAGYSVGWTAERTKSTTVTVTVPEGQGTISYPEERVVRYTEEVRLVTKDEVAAAREKVDVLKKWQLILADATEFIIANDARKGSDESPNVAKDPAALTEFTKEALEAYLVDVVLVPAVAAGEEPGAVEVPAVTLISYMLKVLNNADEKVDYVIADGVKTVLAYAELDSRALNAALAAKKADYETARDEMVEKFQINGLKSYAEIAALNALISDEDDNYANDILGFIKHAIKISDTTAPYYADYAYLNLAVSNEYTENKIDLFSQIFNERIMAGYFRSLMLVKEYAEEKLEENYFGAHTMDWLVTAVATLNEYQKSTETFTDIAVALTAVRDAWRFIDVNYEEAVMSIIADGGANASYKGLVYEEKNGVEGFQFDTTDVAGYLITATTNPGLQH